MAVFENQPATTSSLRQFQHCPLKGSNEFTGGLAAWADETPTMDSSGAVPAYSHTPLPTSTSIRLLTGLQIDDRPQKWELDWPPTRLRFSLQVVDLNDSDDPPEYICLSYTWGNPFRVYPSKQICLRMTEKYKKQVPVICDDKLLYLGYNLYEFLVRALVFSQQPDNFTMICGVGLCRGWWIDATCINQADLEERAHQVRIMDRIYSGAKLVLAWLGEADEFSAPAMQVIEKLSYKERERVLALDPLFDDLTPIGINRLPCRQLYAYFNRAWFRRAWILQEVVLAQRLFAVCGSVMMDFSLLLASANFLHESNWWILIATAMAAMAGDWRNQKVTELLGSSRAAKAMHQDLEDRLSVQGAGPLYEPDQNTQFNPMVALSQIKALRKAYGKSSTLLSLMSVQYDRPTYKDLFTQNRFLQSTDPRDMVYAFLGLRPELDIPTLLAPDYGSHIRASDVYVAATRHALAEANDLSILSHRESADADRDGSLPSWVPDFRIPKGPTIGDAPISPWSASQGLPLPTAFVSTDERALDLHGLLLDSITEISRFPEPFEGLSLFASFLRLLPAYYVMKPRDDFHSIHDPYDQHTSLGTLAEHYEAGIFQSRVEVLWRTLLANGCVDQYPAPVEYGHAFAVNIERKIIHLTYSVKFQGLFGQEAAAPDMGARLLNSLHAIDELSEGEHPEDLKLVQSDEAVPRWSSRRFLPTPTLLIRRIEIGDIAPPDSRNVLDFKNRMYKIAERRLLFITTERRYLGYGPDSIRIGDQVWILAGGKVPFILRPKVNGRFELVGEAYVHGIMHGEAVRGREKDFTDVVVE
ncbi:hypothetical protein LTR17_001965 [Elasticomyces elasticus]|nr:hypothetical protein LTR17_001965 [Elasticomyces elasticus]